MKHIARAKGLFKPLIAVATAIVCHYASFGAGTFIEPSKVSGMGGAKGGDLMRLIDNNDGTFDIVHIFTNTVTSTFSVPADNNIVSGSMRALVVAGGGAGSGNCGGGGGAGGLIFTNFEAVVAGDYQIMVGAGGKKSAGNALGGKGSDTTFTYAGKIYTALGGGNGGRYGSTAGAAGGSGGGACGGGSVGAGNQPTSASGGFGHAGGKGAGSNRGGGGGGANGPGLAATGNDGGKGGPGLEYDISGESVVYAAGGGGAGISGGAAGAAGGSTAGAGTPGALNLTGGSADPGSGSGGGGAAGGGGTSYGGAGGSGTVIIRYTVGKAMADGSTVYEIKDDGQFTLPKAALVRILAVGGGGAGGSGTVGQNGAGNGGGGAGRLIDGTNILFAATYDIDVGAGGTNAVNTTASTSGGDGKPTSISTNGVNVIYMPGGGGGGVSGATAGRAGGSSGGASKGGTSANPVSTYGGLGNIGGTSSVNRTGGGGGGAGGQGGNASSTSVAGDGGKGYESNITGEPVFYAAGGGGGARTGTGGAGGSGIGGTGGGAGAGSEGKIGTGSGGGGGGNGNAAGPGGSGIVVIRVIRYMPVKPEDNQAFEYDGDYHTIAFDDEAVAVSGVVSTNAVGTYTTTFTLKEVNGVKYVWSDGTTAAITRTWKITPPALVIDSFSLEGWQVGEAPNKPVIDSTPRVGDSEVVFYYSTSAEGPWTDTTVPDAAGTYYVKAVIESENFTHDHANDPVAQFSLWEWDGEKYPSYLGYHADIYAPVFEGEAVEKFAMLVRISTSSPKDFYKQARADGSDVRFTDADGNLLPFEVDTYNPQGDSFYWVKVPSYASGAYACTINWGDTGEEIEGETNYRFREVWDGYVGVWHMNDAADSSANDMKSALGSSARTTNGYFGSGIGASASGSPYISAEAAEAMKNLTNGNFTASFWMKFDDSAAIGAPFLFGRRRNASANGGWAAQVWSQNFATSLSIGVYSGVAGDGKFSTRTVDGFEKNVWYRMDFVLGSEYTLYVNGVNKASFAPGDIANPLDEATKFYIGGLDTGNTLKGAMDEFRIRPGGVDTSSSQFKAEQAQLTQEETDFGVIVLTPDVTLKNRWVVLPSVSPDTWPAGTTGDVDPGLASHGTVEWVFSNPATSEVLTNAIPSEAGDWRLDFFVKPGASGTRSWEGLEYQCGGVSIFEEFPYSNLGGTAGSSTLSGRVLLANDDSNEACPVEGQAYWLAAGSGTTYWVHRNEVEKGNFSHMTEATVHDLYSTTGNDELCGSTAIWHIDNARIGNVYPSDASKYADYPDRVYMPVSSSAGPFTSPTAAPGLAETAHIVLRNVENAAVYSPCYTNGIGTIYFDAANAGTSATGEGYGICVEFATVATNGMDSAGNPFETAPATDEFVHQIVPAYDEETQDDEGVDIIVHHDAETNLFAYAKWEAVDVIPLKRDDTESFVRLDVTNLVQLAISTGGSQNNFYRIIVPDINYRGPIRFRIRRTEVNQNYATNPDGAAFILIDNVIVSYPPMKTDLGPLGKFDPSLGGDVALGWENAFTTPFPSITDDAIYARATTNVFANPGNPAADPSKFVVSAKAHYRWRYLEQQFEPESGWLSVRIPPAADYAAEDPLQLTAGEIGDVEFWYESVQNAPYYRYVDYTGRNLGVDGYSEEIRAVTNAYWNAQGGVVGKLETGGTNWFVRLRQGASPYESVNLLYKTIDVDGTESAEAKTVEMRLCGDNIWRGYLKTIADGDDDVPDIAMFKYRFEALNRQTEGSVEFEENTAYFKPRESSSKLPVTGYVDEQADGEGWETVPCDFATGYFLFQLDTDTLSLSIVHSDFQNFNAWNDAKGTVFVGTSTSDDSKSGTSSRSRAMYEDFSAWGDMSKTNVLWQENFINNSTTQYAGWEDYKTFSGLTTENGWTAGQGQWVNQYYRDTQLVGGLVQRSFKMEGEGRGYLQFVDAATVPRGLDTVSFTARIGQSVRETDISYYDADVKSSMSNYVFFARGAFDLKKNKDFSGNASLSLIANYRPRVGFYEFRFEQEIAALNSAKTAVTGINAKGQYLKLFRWKYNSKGKLVATQLTGKSPSKLQNPVNMPEASGLGGNYLPMFISVSNETSGAVMIMAGIRRDGRDGGRDGISATAGQSDQSNKSYAMLVYRDNSEDKLTCGTYGLLSANCPGVFDQPYFYDKPAVATVGSPFPGYNYLDWYSTCTMTFAGTATSCHAAISGGNWSIMPGRMEPFYVSGTQWGIRASTPEEPLFVYTAPAGTTKFGDEPIAVTNVTGFGTAGKAGSTYVFNIRSIDNCSVKIADGAEVDDVHNDIVIDDVVLTQWRGGDWNDTLNQAELSKIVPNWSSDDGGSAGHTNFLFTSAWVTNNAVLLSARRTYPDRPSSIRTPLFDGMYGRGIGLGMISFEYENAQTNANVLVQIATNGVTYATVNAIDDFDNLKWTTVTNFDFGASGITDSDRKSGSRSCYLGLHGVAGLMRLVIDPKIAQAVAGSQNPSAFGEITIKSVFCRDEPELDKSSWWGWNLRTLGQDESGLDSEKRMFLYDLTKDPSRIGLSFALNNSTTDGIDPTKSEEYKQHAPFLQTPTFATNLVGEVSFRARKYDASSQQPGQVTLFGSVTGSVDGRWTKLKVFSITNTTYGTYSYKTDPNDTYAAFRLAVTGVSGIVDTQMSNESPEGYDDPVRVLLDEVAVFEAIRAKIGFLNVGTIKNTDTYSALDTAKAVAGVPGEEWQPLCNESWGVQCEIYPAQLGDEIDFDRAGGPTVILHWFNGDSPWGYDNWKNAAGAKSAFLSKATDSNMVYRSSYLSSPDAVIPLSTASGQVVQYMLEVVYYTKESSQPLTNRLSSAEWQNPSWYFPIDKNAGADSFSAYSILDTVAPHWAWINEVNIYGEYDSNYENSDKNFQYVEIAVPQEADITGWSVELLDPYENNGYVYTNVLGRFGTGLLSGKKSIGAASNMTFRVLGNKAAWTSGNLKYSDGTLDGVWENDIVRQQTQVFTSAGEISAIDPIGLRLVRASGIVEHEIVVRGLDWFSQFDDENAEDYTNVVNYLNTTTPTKGFFWVGDDEGGASNSRGVFTGSGAVSNEWNDTMVRTPGRINQNQFINPDHPTPNGSSILIYANVDMTGGHIYQTVGDAVKTNESQIIVIKKGSEIGTNITYTVDSWYELGNVTTNGRAAAWSEVPGEARTYVVNVGLFASNNITVEASAAVASNLVDLGITDDNVYKPAVMKWLETGRDAYGNLWEAADSGEVKLAKFIPLHRPGEPQDMTLTEMYWLDMDPTVGNLGLVAGIGDVPGPVIVDGYAGSASVTNVRMSVFMSITNLATGAHWTPYILRGIDYDLTSWKYKEAGGSWDSATFKIIGVLANGLTSESAKRNRIPLRWFVFDEDSFDPVTCKSVIDVEHPYSPDSPAYYQGFKEWMLEHGTGTPVFYGWDLDDRKSVFTTEILKKENYLHE